VRPEAEVVTGWRRLELDDGGGLGVDSAPESPSGDCGNSQAKIATTAPTAPKITVALVLVSQRRQPRLAGAPVNQARED
jgi:hypothetical protein